MAGVPQLTIESVGPDGVALVRVPPDYLVRIQGIPLGTAGGGALLRTAPGNVALINRLAEEERNKLFSPAVGYERKKPELPAGAE